MMTIRVPAGAREQPVVEVASATRWRLLANSRSRSCCPSVRRGTSTTGGSVGGPAEPRLPALQPHDRVVLVGNTLAERKQLFNHFETSLLTRFPELQLTVRNLGWSGDTPTLQPRPLNFGDATHAPDRAEGRRHPGVLRPQRVVRRRSRPAAVRDGSRGLSRAASCGALQRQVGAAPRAGVAHRARAAGAARPRRRRRAQPRARPLHRGHAPRRRRPRRRRSSMCSRRRKRRWHRAAPAHDQRHPPERDRRSRVAGAADRGARPRRTPRKRRARRSKRLEALRELVREKNQLVLIAGVRSTPSMSSAGASSRSGR